MNPAALRDRLREVIGGGRSAPARAVVPAGDPANEANSSGSTKIPPSDRGERSDALADMLGGEWRSGVSGRSFVVTRRFAAETPYGGQSVGAFADALTRSADAATMVASAARPPFLFFDLETTGLSGGAGTYAFIVGCGWFDVDGTFVTEQHLLVEWESERGILDLVGSAIAQSGAIVTFNGKSFDVPVLETRYLFHRLQSPCGRLAHVDVLHPARRFWGGSVDSGCSLMTLEAQVLGARRTGDVPGFEIPARYFQFVRSGDARPLAAVLEHNRLDLLSLAGLTARLLHLAQSGPADAFDAREALALARIYERAGLDARAEDALVHALQLCGRAPIRRDAVLGHVPHGTTLSLRVEALRALALNARRRRRYEDAARWWRQLLDVGGCPRQVVREAAEALAIHHEHRVRDLATAKTFALRGLEIEGERAWGDAVRHRLARIERKMLTEPPRLFPSSRPSPPSSGFPKSEPRTSS